MIEIIVSIITLLGTIVTVVVGNKKNADMITYRIEQLEKKQDKHNNLIARMYAVEDKLNIHDEKLKVVNHRIEDLENK